MIEETVLIVKEPSRKKMGIRVKTKVEVTAFSAKLDTQNIYIEKYDLDDNIIETVAIENELLEGTAKGLMEFYKQHKKEGKTRRLVSVRITQ